ncbi:MAG: DUF5666 domain-containing protein [Solirubrobacterales bacterium]
MAAKRVSSLLAALVAAAALLAAVLAAPAGAAVRHLDGTVVSRNAEDHSFRLSTQSGTLRIRVDSATRFERISGFGGLRKGLAVEVDAKQTSTGLLAKQIETQGGGGGGDHSGGDDHGGGGADDGPNHT